MVFASNLYCVLVEHRSNICVIQKDAFIGVFYEFNQVFCIESEIWRLKLCQHPIQNQALNSSGFQSRTYIMPENEEQHDFEMHDCPDTRKTWIKGQILCLFTQILTVFIS